MALTTIPASADLCNWLNLLSTGDLVLATSEADYTALSLCDLGAAILATDEVVDPSYKLVVLDTDDECLKWKSQTSTPIYDSSLMRPWIRESASVLSSQTPGAVWADALKINLLTTDFSVASKVLVTFTMMGNDPVVDNETGMFKPRGPVGGVMADLSDWIEVPNIRTGTTYVSSQYTAIVDVPANPGVGALFLGITFKQFNGKYNSVRLRIDAIAFKA